MIYLISNFCKKITQYRSFFKLLRILNVKSFENINSVLEDVYPGITDTMSLLYDRGILKLWKGTVAFVKDNGGWEQLSVYYNKADEQKKKHIQETVLKAFKQDTCFEDQLLLLDKAAKVKDINVLSALLVEIKEAVVLESIDSGQRSVEDWSNFIRRMNEAGNDIKLGVLEKLESNTTDIRYVVEELNASDSHDEEKDCGAKKEEENKLIDDLITDLYKYNGEIFQSISTIDEFKNILTRKKHKEIITACKGKKIPLYNILFRYHIFIDDYLQDIWLKDIAGECGYDVATIKKKYPDRPKSTTKLQEEIEALFEKHEEKKREIRKKKCNHYCPKKFSRNDN